MYTRVRAFLEQRITLLTRLLAGSAVALWILGEVVPAVGDWIRAQNLWAAILIVMVAEVINRLAQLKPQFGSPAVTVYADQDEAMSELIAAVRKNPPKSADLVLQSSLTMGELLRELVDAKTRIRLLIQHPDWAPNEFQKKQVEQSLTNLLGVTLASYTNAQVFCYRSPASIRGCRLGTGLVALGWYRYDNRTADVLQGHTNALVVARASQREGKALLATFTTAFDALLNAPDTEPAGTTADRSGLLRRLLTKLMSRPRRRPGPRTQALPNAGRKKHATAVGAPSETSSVSEPQADVANDPPIQSVGSRKG